MAQCGFGAYSEAYSSLVMKINSQKLSVGSVAIHPDLEAGVVLKCSNVGICYRKPAKLGFGLIKKEREYWPFRNLDFDLKEGETLGVFGRNGVGKSTLLRLLAGVVLPDEGEIVVKPNQNVQLLSVNLGFERILSGRENSLMAGMLLGKSRADMMSKLDRIKEFSELGEFFEKPVYSYSSGMVARLGFSIALEADPDILLLDEVLAVGDQAFRDKSREEMKRLIKSGKSVVLVMHNRKQLESMSDRIYEF